MKPGFTLFDSALGACGVAWTGRGICAFALPGADRATFSESLPAEVRTYADRPPAPIRAAIARVTAHLAGRPDPLDDLALDLTRVAGFRRRAYEELRGVKPGETISYGELARRAGAPGGARAAGRAMATNPIPLIVPCHRVLAAGNRLGGFNGGYDLEPKKALLRLEGATWRDAGGGRARGAPNDASPASASAGSAGVPGRRRPQVLYAAAARTLAAADPDLARVIAAVGPCRLAVDGLSSPFQALLESIVYQQLTGKAAATIFGRLKARLAPGGEIAPDAVLAAPDEALRGAGLSRAKTAAVRDLAQKALAGRIPPLAALRTMDDDAIVDRLTEVRGIGRWTVEMLLIFRLGRPDVLPADDYGIRKGFAAAFGLAALPAPKAVSARGERWRPFRTVASWYLWRAGEKR